MLAGGVLLARLWFNRGELGTTNRHLGDISMSTLTGRTIAASYKELLKTSSSTGLSASPVTIEDGDATVSALSLSTAGISSSGALGVSGSTSLNTLSVSGTSAFTGNASFATLSSSDFSATMVGGTINGASIGSTNPSTGVFTQVNVTGAGALRLEDTAGGQYVGFKSPTTIATSYTLTLPSVTGSAGFALITDGSGNLTWQNPYGGGAVSLISAGDTSLAIVDTGTGSIAGSVDGVQKFLLDASGMSITGDLTVSGTFAGTATNANTLTTGRNFSITGDVTAPAISFNGSGAVALASTLASGVVNNTNVGASAAIAFSKLASLTSGNVLVGSASNVPTSVAVSGDATISNTGAVTIANSAVTNAKVSASAAIDFSKLASLTSANILVGNVSNVAASVAMSGDATLSNAGAITIANGAITTVKILNSNVTSAKVDTASVAVLGTAQQYTRTHNFFLNTPLTDGASIAWDASQNQVATVTLTATGRALANPTNIASGAVYILIVKQNGTGNNTLSFGGNYKWPSSATPAVTQTANSASILTFISDGTYMYGVSSLNYT